MTFVYSNEELLRTTGWQSIAIFAERIQSKWLAHCIRMKNDALQEISLFMIPSKKNFMSTWTRVEKNTTVDREQFWTMASDKKRLNHYTVKRYDSLWGESPE